LTIRYPEPVEEVKEEGEGEDGQKKEGEGEEEEEKKDEEVEEAQKEDTEVCEGGVLACRGGHCNIVAM